MLSKTETTWPTERPPNPAHQAPCPKTEQEPLPTLRPGRARPPTLVSSRARIHTVAFAVDRGKRAETSLRSLVDPGVRVTRLTPFQRGKSGLSRV